MRGRTRLIAAAAAAAVALAALGAALVTRDWRDDSGSGGTAASSETIPQPPLGKLTKLTRRRLAPAGRRVDLAVPSFSDPTAITNPLFPISDLRSVVLVGKLDGQPWRAETTLLPRTKIVHWNGRRVETLESQFVAYLNGRIFEVAVDHYAQADDGSVWYFGEDAFTYERGRVADTEGTWLAGVDGPPAMIMPARPRVGDVYRTENVPGLVFEQVTVKRVGTTVDGPTGPVAGAMVGRELHMDEVRLEDKTFAPGYGEFHSGAGRTFEATALAVPADALHEPSPTQLKTLSKGADHVFDDARSKQWKAASATGKLMVAAWATFRETRAPKLLAAEMSGALDALARAVDSRSERSGVLALDVARTSLDLQLRYRRPAEIDLARLDVWTRQLSADATAMDWAAATGDVATLRWIRERVGLGGIDAGRLEAQLRAVEAEAKAHRLGAVTAAAARLRATMARFKP